MNRETDRVAVPTNGRKPHDVAEPPVTAGARAAGEAAGADAGEAGGGPTARGPVAKVTSPELTIAVTPAQVAVGFGVIAGIILLLLRRRRGRRQD